MQTVCVGRWRAQAAQAVRSWRARLGRSSLVFCNNDALETSLVHLCSRCCLPVYCPSRVRLSRLQRQSDAATVGSQLPNAGLYLMRFARTGQGACSSAWRPVLAALLHVCAVSVARGLLQTGAGFGLLLDRGSINSCTNPAVFSPERAVQNHWINPWT